ncbi:MULTISPECIES: hypothetical protein [Bacteria]|uniref:hypothetical protein n=1 Tax=Bacteria TaxID=2 RepID=UPI00044706C2|nr:MULTISPECIES: hypothetical protein [Bacteria]HBQ8863640.1 hypothetical protein [Klebsiella variicola subsp. variicola]EKV0856078.1 hypothetical protein [Klebsiella pneumoniae]ELA0638970.1 hypothetical protein [Klebsiella pneumoniae]ELA0945630.1 hypothetical protein [Klebsiella pneumoniae]ELA3304536.1 hypothetical protein [Klebsiella pneumoniae]
MTTDITELAQSLKAAAIDAKELAIIARYSKGRAAAEKFYALANPNNVIALVEALEKVQSRDVTQAAKDYHFDQQADRIAELDAELEREREKTRRVMSRIAELESRTVKLPDGWQFEECEIEGCENGAIFSVGTGSRNIHLCDKCAHEHQNSRLKKSPLSKRLPFKMSAGIKVEAE